MLRKTLDKCGREDKLGTAERRFKGRTSDIVGQEAPGFC
jgi:hypothetical protein